MSIDTNGTAPDLRIALKLISLEQYPTIQLQLRIQPMPGKVLKDITLRMVLLKSADSPFLDDGPLETGAGFVVLQYRVGPTRKFPPEVRIDLASGVVNDDPGSTDPPPPIGTPETIPVATRLTVDRVGLDIVADGASADDPLDVGGGLVTGDMVWITGVETDYNSLFNNGYSETPRQIRGIALDRLEIGAPPTATLPRVATWFEMVATDPAPSSPPGVPANPPLKISVDLRTPTRGDAPGSAPTVATAPGGGLRFGSYRYSTTFLHKNGNETGASPRSEPVTITSSSGRLARITNLPAPPPDPSPDVTELHVTKIRIYRTDCDGSVDPSDADRGDRGEDVLVAEVNPSTASVDDPGPADPAAEPKVRSDYMAVRYWAGKRLDLVAAVRMIDGDDDTHYEGAVKGAPTRLKVLYRPGSRPRLRWLAFGKTPLLSVGMPELSLPYGTGMFASIDDVSEKFCLDWLILGSEHLALGVAGDVDVAAPAGRDPSTASGRISVRMGPVVPPVPWPAGEPPVTIELADSDSGAAGGLVVLSGLRRGSVSNGSAAWAQRDTEGSHLQVRTTFAERKGASDRSLRFGYRGGVVEQRTVIDATAHFLPDTLAVDARLPQMGDKSFELGSRVRFLRAVFDVRSRSEGSTEGTHVTGRAFVDDTTDALLFVLGARSIDLTSKWPVRAGATVTVVGDPAGAGEEPMTLWADLIVPPSVKSTTGLPLEAVAEEPGLSGRVAVAWPGQKPLAVRATPQIKLLTNGSAEPTTGLRAVTAGVVGVVEAKAPEELGTAFGDSPPAVSELPVLLRSSRERPNRSLRVEMQQVEHRVPTAADFWSADPARSWMRSRVAAVPDLIEPLLLLEGQDLAGISVKASSPWGEGVVWAEPRFAWERNTDELGSDKGVGLVTAGFDAIPANLEVWLLDHPSALGARVDATDRLPSAGPVGTDWVSGGALLRLDGPVRLSHIMVTLPGDSSRVCRNDDGADHTVRHGSWSSVLSPFVRIEPAEAGTKQLIVWSAHEPDGPPVAESDPCSDSDSTPARKSALGWAIQEKLAMSMAVRIYALATPSGVVSPRWWSMPTGTEEWGGDSIAVGEWELQQEVQMKDYRGTVAIYPRESTDNPFGDWEGGDGNWWLRQRGGLDVPIFLLFGWDVASGDVFMGNVGGGYHMAGTNGIFSTLPKLWTWSYP